MSMTIRPTDTGVAQFESNQLRVGHGQRAGASASPTTHPLRKGGYIQFLNSDLWDSGATGTALAEGLHWP